MSVRGYDSRWVGRMPLALRLVRFVVLRPFLVFAVYFVLVAVLALAPASHGVTALYLLVAPWLLFFTLLLHFPVVGAAIRGFRLPKEVRFNHALEHGTIFFLRRRCGKRFKIGGKAEPDGFRLNGMPWVELVAPAFGELREHLSKGNSRAVVSGRCGSMVVTAQPFQPYCLRWWPLRSSRLTCGATPRSTCSLWFCWPTCYCDTDSVICSRGGSFCRSTLRTPRFVPSSR